MELNELLVAARALAEQAGLAILDIYKGPAVSNVVLKEDQSPVTEADLAANRLLMASLPGLLDVPVLSEEMDIPDYAERSAWQRYWLVDPLDGTREFISGNGEFTVNIALIESGKPVLGVVHAPVTNVIWCGAKGVGAFRFDGGRERRIFVRKIGEKEPLTVVVSRRHGAKQLAGVLARLRQKFGEVTTRQIGSSVKFCLLAEGKADLYPRLTPTCEWDTAAAQAILEAAGGAVLDEFRQPLRYNRKDSLINPSFLAAGDVNFDWRGFLSDD